MNKPAYIVVLGILSLMLLLTGGPATLVEAQKNPETVQKKLIQALPNPVTTKTKEQSTCVGYRVRWSSVPSSVLVQQQFNTCFRWTEDSSAYLEGVTISTSDGFNGHYHIGGYPAPGTYDMCTQQVSTLHFSSTGNQTVTIYGDWVYSPCYDVPCPRCTDQGDSRTVSVTSGTVTTSPPTTSPTTTLPPVSTSSCPTAPPLNLCLNNNRFRIESRWQTPNGATGTGQAVALTGNSGYFWFFSNDNIELVAKLLDGRPINGKFWFFCGTMTDVEFWITVTDTSTNQQKMYHNPMYTMGNIRDTSAF